MSEKNEAWQVDCKTEEIYLGLAKLAESNGWALAGTGTAKTGFAWRWLAWKKDVSGWRMYGYSGKPNESFVISIDEAIRRLEAGPPKQDDRIFVEKTIEDWHEVEFLDDGSVKVGCQTISKEDVAEIARRIERGPVRFGGHTFWLLAFEGQPYHRCKWNGIEVPIETVGKIIARAGVKVESEEGAEEKKPESSILREFVEALAINNLGGFKYRYGIDLPISADPYEPRAVWYRELADKALEIANKV